MRIIGVRADGAQLVAVGGGVSVILKGDQKSKPLDDRKAEKLGPWTPQGDNLADRRSVQKQLDRARVVLKLSEAMPRQTFNLVGPGKHSQKWHDCWEKVQAKGHDESSAAAICTAQLGDESYDASIAEEVPNAMELGGAGSGNWGHAGRPGEIGGSGGGGGETAPAYQRGDQVVVTGGGNKVQAHHSSPTRVMIPAGTQGRYIRPAGDDWHIVDTGHYESARVRGDQLRAYPIEGPGAGGSNAFERGGAHGPTDTRFERGGPAPSSPRAGGGENLEWKNEPALPKYKPNPSEWKPTAADRAARSAVQAERLVKADPSMTRMEAERKTGASSFKPTAADQAARKAVSKARKGRDTWFERSVNRFKQSVADERAAQQTEGDVPKLPEYRGNPPPKAKKLSVGEMVRIIGNVRGQGQTARVLRIDGDTALVDGFGRFDLLDLAAFGKPKAEEPMGQAAPPEPEAAPAPQEPTAPTGEGAIVKAIKPSEPIGGKRIKKQKPMIAKPLYNVAAVRKPKVKIVKPIAVAT